ncbi:Speckle-type POZ protein-like B like protein [Argiope bruennichi]|uniref:Speckle-type POZ protein-like B like protein n=1 Tax=Argiope bruennichi TaxID=94029 RepID=A0A8T0FEH2_ARGBR|nr:Speckle-type POZ protein-like B like protein [Argiope bruennichi]
MENEERNMFQYIWKIENYSYCWQEVNEFIASPVFQMCTTEGSSWCLKLYPRGVASFNNSTGLYLERQLTIQGPVFISVDYELSFLRSDGTPEYTAGEKACVFIKGQSSGFSHLLSREEIFQTKKSILLPDDTLTVQCRICFESIGLARQIQAFAKSKIWVHRELFVWDTGEFNYVSPFGPGCFAKFTIHKAEISLKLCEDSIYVTLEAIDDVAGMLRFRTGIVDSDRSTSKYLVDEYMHNKEKQSITTFLITRSKLLQRKDFYLPQGHLILHCESIYSKGIHIGQIESHTYDKIFMFNPFDERKKSKKNQTPVTPSCCSANSSMREDFQNLYQEGTLSDFTVKVGGEDLQAHKAILCARSPVFKAMLTSNMSENENNVVEISDLQAETVRRMLIFMYTNTVDDLDWDTAKKLYFAADKYDIAILKQICSDFLKINLKLDNVGEVLALANMHSDEDLKNVALEFLQCIIKRKTIT